MTKKKRTMKKELVGGGRTSLKTRVKMVCGVILKKWAVVPTNNESAVSPNAL